MAFFESLRHRFRRTPRARAGRAGRVTLRVEWLEPREVPSVAPVDTAAAPRPSQPSEQVLADRAMSAVAAGTLTAENFTQHPRLAAALQDLYPAQYQQFLDEQYALSHPVDTGLVAAVDTASGDLPALVGPVVSAVTAAATATSSTGAPTTSAPAAAPVNAAVAGDPSAARPAAAPPAISPPATTAAAAPAIPVSANAGRAETVAAPLNPAAASPNSVAPVPLGTADSRAWIVMGLVGAGLALPPEPATAPRPSSAEPATGGALAPAPSAAAEPADVPWLAGLLTPAPVLAAARPLLAFGAFISQTVSERPELTSGLTTLLSSPWLGGTAVAIAAAALTGQHARHLGRRGDRAIDVPEISGPGQLT